MKKSRGVLRKLVEKTDPEMARIFARENQRQRETLVLIASENYASPAVLAAMASPMTNKYAEGYPGRRYYHGCQHVDEAEKLAVERAKQLFGAEHVNVQVHTGSQANMATYYALLEIGDPILGMRGDMGGHLTHGSDVNFSGRWYRSLLYGVDKKTERIDYDNLARLAREHRPRLIMTGASAYPRQIDFAKCKEIAEEVNAYLVADIAHIVGLVAAHLHPDPVPVSDVITTTTHKTLRGPRGAMILCQARHAETIDRAVFPGVQAGPMMHMIAARAVALEQALQPEFHAYQVQIIKNAQALAEALLRRGFRLVSGGTDNHLMLVDLSGKGIKGCDAADALDEAGMSCNKNRIPYDPLPAAVTSGIRLGTPAVTTRGMKEGEMEKIATLIERVISNPEDKAIKEKVKGEVVELCKAFPIYEEL